ncbi:MAG TPA: HD domain-containing protein [Candidatus Acidoferrales bacterium]|nr:HD domain-containing protein [Candidatus Acidoferrales bacterium]
MYIRDPIHTSIDFDEFQERVLNTKEMQRLRQIKQMGFCNLVYPGANNTRFEHCVGVMHVARELEARVYDEPRPEVAYIGLLHDIGHGPFSHQSEPVIKKYLHKSHEQMGEDMVRNSEIKDILNEAGLDLDFILGYFKDEMHCEIVGGALGADRVDYLMRDSLYTGVAYGIIDYTRIKSKMASYNGRPAIYEQGVSGAESLLIARYFMIKNVYMHHVELIAEGMFQNALIEAIDGGKLDPLQVHGLTDSALLENLKGLEGANGSVHRILGRRLFKRASYELVGPELKREEVVSALEGLGLGTNDYVVYLGELRGSMSDIAVVEKNGELVGNLSEISPLIKTLNNTLASERRLLVACDEKNREKVSAAMDRLVKPAV